MKAKFIYESISFERGLTPAESMGIGNKKAQNRMKLERFTNELGLEFVEDKKGTWRILVPYIKYYESTNSNSIPGPYLIPKKRQKSFQDKGYFPVEGIQYTVNYPKGWEDSETPMSLRVVKYRPDGKIGDQNLIGRFDNMFEIIRRIKINLDKITKKAEKYKEIPEE
jgi:hypothetical protein